jgi:Flp pilus assembly pilin Flp
LTTTDKSTRRAAVAGQGLVEYGLIIGLSTLLTVAILALFGDQVADVVRWVGETVDAATRGA